MYSIAGTRFVFRPESRTVAGFWVVEGQPIALRSPASVSERGDAAVACMMASRQRVPAPPRDERPQLSALDQSPHRRRSPLVPNMPYVPIDPPFAAPPAELSTQEIRRYYSWFLGVIPERVQVLGSAVRETTGFASWQPDGSRASLAVLGDWFALQVETAPIGIARRAKILASLKFPVEIPARDLTSVSLSLAMDVGIYLACSIRKNVPGVEWHLQLGGKTRADYGRPVLRGLGAVPLDPVHVATVLSSKLADGLGAKLVDLYDVWVAQAPRA